nr:hypothetical protein KXZ65_04065 [Pectobacterium sp. PL152]
MMLTTIPKIQHVFPANRRSALWLRLAFLLMALYYAPLATPPVPRPQQHDVGALWFFRCRR